MNRNSAILHRFLHIPLAQKGSLREVLWKIRGYAAFGIAATPDPPEDRWIRLLQAVSVLETTHS